MAPRPVNGLALCSGGGGLELGVRLALGPRYRAVAHVERDPFAAAVLVARMAEQALDPAPVWDDLCTFDGRPWRGVVDLVTAGFPCQPWSAAGQRRGVDDDRWLWPDIARVVAEVGPRLVLLENVPGLLSGGLGHVLGDLADLGFDAEWDVFSAADVGAPHLRKRVFVLAWLAESPGSGSQGWGVPAGRRPEGSRASFAHGTGADVADARSPGRPEVPQGAHADESEHARGSTVGTDVADRRSEDVAHAHGGGWWPWERLHDAGEPDAGRSSTHAGTESVASCHLGDPSGAGQQGCVHGAPQWREGSAGPGDLWPPRPDDRPAWERASRAGLPQPAVRRVADGLASRLDRLHCIGNGVVPLVAGYALRRLTERAGLDLEGGLDVSALFLVDDIDGPGPQEVPA